MIPIHHAQIISGAISVAAQMGQLAVNTANKIRAATFLEKANEDFFNLRGLKLEVATSKAVKAKLGMDPEAPLAEPFEQCSGLSVHERRMASLRDYVAPVTFEVPPPNEQTDVLKRMAAAQQKRTLQKQDKEALKDRGKYTEKKTDAEQKIGERSSKVEEEIVKLARDREKVVNKHEKEAAKVQKESEKELLKKPSETERIEKRRVEEMAKLDRDFQKELTKLDEEQDKLNKDYEKDTTKKTKDARKEDKEVKASEKILWIFVENGEGG